MGTPTKTTYVSAYSRLNAQQRKAVDAIDGPVLVIAGPGTGKTQLLTTRIAHILATTDTLPESILCLTFTDAAASNMRERLSSMIGSAAYNVTMSTYHAFGSDMLSRYPEFFDAWRELSAADDLTIDQLLRQIQAGLPYRNPLKGDVFLRDLRTLLSNYKQALLTPDQVAAVASANERFITSVTPLVQEHVGSVLRISKSSIPLFRDLLDASQALSPADPIGAVQPLQAIWVQSLTEAVEAAEASSKTQSLSAWKAKWLVKDGTGQFMAAGANAVRKQRAAAEIYERYLQLLEAGGWYDYDDMILQAIAGLSSSDELRFTVQERYQYILLDEFQDTNEAQLKLVQLLTDNPVNEGRPNVLAVGDDDQAIFAFQGAHYSHMLDFYNHYRDTLVVPLTDNYRSQEAILRTSEGVTAQISERLHQSFPAIDKTLIAAASFSKTATIQRTEFTSDLSQFAWVSNKISELLQSGMPANEIAVLAPKHRFLEPLVPFLRQANIPVRYEKREDVLEDPAIRELLSMSKLVQALSQRDVSAVNAAWPHIISMPFWNIPTEIIWQLSWQVDRDKTWTDVLLADESTKPLALFFIRLSLVAETEPLETMLDYIIGSVKLDLQSAEYDTFTSPFFAHYFGASVPQPEDTADFWQLLANLNLLRARLSDYRPNHDSLLTLNDFVAFCEAHRQAHIKILNTNPYQESDEAVQLMTAFKAKGQEFAAVFVLALNDEVWGSRAKGKPSSIAIPENLRFIQHAGDSEDERLRLLYVAFTRAKTDLYLANYVASMSGQKQNRLKYLDERSTDEGIVSPLLPTGRQIVQELDTEPPTINQLDAYWHGRHHTGSTNPRLRTLLQNRLVHFQLSATQVSRFANVLDDGPTSFLLRDLLKFPHGSSPQGKYGDAIHESLYWLQTRLKVDGSLPSRDRLLAAYDGYLAAKQLTEQDHALLTTRGHDCLTAYYAQRASEVRAQDISEHNFRDEAVFIGDAHLAGKIDRLIVDREAKTITIVDFKTGRSHARWTNEAKLYRYKQQLYFYKLLVEGSHTFKGYRVIDAYLEFVEPDEDGIIQKLHVKLDDAEQGKLAELIQVIWEHIHEMNFPDVSNYAATMAGVLQFEQDLRERTI